MVIHVNRGNQPHEWLTEKDFEQQYPKLLPKIELIKRQKGLRERREAAGITLRQLSDKIKISTTMLSDIEIGAIAIGDNFFNRIVTALEEAEKGAHDDSK